MNHMSERVNKSEKFSVMPRIWRCDIYDTEHDNVVITFSASKNNNHDESKQVAGQLLHGKLSPYMGRTVENIGVSQEILGLRCWFSSQAKQVVSTELLLNMKTAFPFVHL